MTSGYEYNVIPVRHFVRHGRNRRLHLSAYTVARYRFAVFFADGKSKSRLLDVRRTVEHDEIFVRNTLGVLVDVVVLIVLFKSVFRLQS